MNLSFSTEINGQMTYFPARIMLLGYKDFQPGKKGDFEAYVPDLAKLPEGTRPKLHTVRDDNTDRWHVGNKIHFVTHLRTSQQKLFGVGKCKGVQGVQLYLSEGEGLRVYIDGRLLNAEEALEFALNDGFDSWDTFLDWFKPLVEEDRTKADEGRKRKLIHWTDLIY